MQSREHDECLADTSENKIGQKISNVWLDSVIKALLVLYRSSAGLQIILGHFQNCLFWLGPLSGKVKDYGSAQLTHL